MTFNYIRSGLLVLAICIFACGYAQATSFVGKVIEINDGDEITIFNMNRPVRIRLIGMDAPESNQPFGDVARQHLSDLIFEKVVLVEYSGIGQHSSLIGRVLLNDIDISAQMIRDGAAWFDPQARLSDQQREIYLHSEQAARQERRGLWQKEGAIAPWEFVKTENDKKRSYIVAKPSSVNTPKVSNATPELNSMTLLRTSGRAARPLDNLSDAYAAMNETRKPWDQFQPKGENFSAMVPKGGLEETKPIPFHGQSINFNYYTVRDGYSVYALIWAIGPNENATDAEAIQFALEGIYKGMNAAFDASRLTTDFECEPAGEKKLPVVGYVGKEFDLSSCPIRGMARIYTRRVGAQRQIYVGYVFSNDMEPTVTKFINSFRVVTTKTVKSY